MKLAPFSSESERRLQSLIASLPAPAPFDGFLRSFE